MRYIIIFLLVFSSGCGRASFRQVRYVSTRDVDAKELPERFAKLLPEKFSLIDTIVFKYRGRAFSGIGYTYVDTRNNIFKVACLNPVGVKLFEITACENEVKTNFVLEKFSELGDLSKAVAEDIKRIYFNRIPSKDAQIRKTRNKVIFRHQKDEGILEHVFAGVDKTPPFKVSGGSICARLCPQGYEGIPMDNLLITKNYYEKERLIWSVSYYQWHNNHGKIYPAGVVFKHHRYKYELVSRLREIRP
ncbi:MAG: hypothetical protein KJ629_05290 [Candidatus Omnitrophica bacterium]|nr:hypothetical protein [Candidatus Omnitrophota bacterium]MBU1810540.1 hypothetical protein [Candidatus Omnitrophota bacterium]